MSEIRISLEDVYSASRLFVVKQFKQGDPYFVYYPDTTLLASIICTGQVWEQTGGRKLDAELINVLGAHIAAARNSSL